MTRDLDADSALIASATPGPLTVGRVPPDDEPHTYLIGSGGVFWCRVIGSPGRDAAADAAFFAAAREGWPWAIAEVRRLTALLAGLNETFTARGDEIDRLHALVEAAYREGFENGVFRVHRSDADGKVETGWQTSRAKEALEQ